jgi:hypothetical protein
MSWNKNLKILIFLGFSVLTTSLFATEDPSQKEDEFSFYFSEFTTHQLEKSEPMAKLIVQRLAQALFDTSSKSEFELRLRILRTALKTNPELFDRFMSLDARLRDEFDTRVKKAKEKRLLFAAGGTVVGALVGIPAGKLLSQSTSLGSKIIWITIPAGALAGGGAGFLLGDILEMPNYGYHDGDLRGDLDLDRKELEDLKNDK